MNKAIIKNIIGIIFGVLIGVGLAYAGGQQSTMLSGIPVFVLVVAGTFILNWIIFIIAFIKKSEKFYDLTGSLTYISMTTAAVLLSPSINQRSVLLLALVVMWATRLGTFLFVRVMEQGKDDRFDQIKQSFTQFLLTWTLQGVWVSFTAAAAWGAITSTTEKPLGWLALIGFLVFVIGYYFELVSDTQKSRFKANPNNEGNFIQEGLWAWSRHPNYFGEIVIWIGVALIALPVLKGWALVTLVSPVWVTLQLTLISGIPMLEKKADKRWGGQAAYEAYKKNTPILIPRPPSKKG